MSRCYVYVVDRDFGFAPNPFHGLCTLATCKPAIRARALVKDWIVGMGGKRLDASGRCIYAMRVSETLSFDHYWADPRYRDKRPERNGSNKMLVGDNVYHRDEAAGVWVQEDSHHSNPDGSVNEHNLTHDISTDCVLVSDHFYYFGLKAPRVPPWILEELGYTNVRNYRVFDHETAEPLLRWLESDQNAALNLVVDDPFDFANSTARYDGAGNKLR